MIPSTWGTHEAKNDQRLSIHGGRMESHRACPKRQAKAKSDVDMGTQGPHGRRDQWPAPCISQPITALSACTLDIGGQISDSPQQKLGQTISCRRWHIACLLVFPRSPLPKYGQIQTAGHMNRESDRTHDHLQSRPMPTRPATPSRSAQGRDRPWRLSVS